MTNSGKFVVIDGQGRIGATTVATLLGLRLTHDGHNVVMAAELSVAGTGIAGWRNRTAQTPGVDARAVDLRATRDRLLTDVIRPALASGRTVVCDRYVPSSLVLNYLAGVPGEQIGSLNAHSDRPDLTVVLVRADHLDQRLASRSVADEAAAYRAIAALLTTAGWRTHLFEVGKCSAAEVADNLLAVVGRELPW
ncbi:dTMP kinase [Actinoplanes sp. NPDC026619]|uniref:dTMP kinase n=1 Tax=Actinoplanes sp. NPDC026619 TaxID=3155798 RepID=UPI0033FE6FEF